MSKFVKDVRSWRVGEVRIILFEKAFYVLIEATYLVEVRILIYV